MTSSNNQSPLVELSFTDEQGKQHALQITSLAKNARTFFCKILVDNTYTRYLHYNIFSGWKDMDHGITQLSKVVAGIIENPLDSDFCSKRVTP
jgi:hypothetical protein